MPTNAARSLALGLNAGTNLASVRNNAKIQREQLAQQEEQDLRQRWLEQFANMVKQTSDLVTKLSPGIEMGDTSSQQSYQALRETVYPEAKQFIEAGIGRFVTAEQASMMGRQFGIAATYVPAQPSIDQAVQAEGAKAKAKAEGELPSQMTLEKERGRQARLTRSVPETQNQNITTRELGTVATNQVEKAAIDSQFRMDRLTQIINDIKDNPEYLQVPGKAKAWWTDVKDKLGFDIGNQEKDFMTNQSKFIRKAIENINQYIKEFTGAQMSEKEAKRLRLAMPDPGEDIFSGQGPAKFASNAQDALEGARLAQARAIYFRNNGIPVDLSKPDADAPISLEEMKKIISDKGMEQAKILRMQHPELSTQEIVNMAKEIVHREYGL